LKVKFITGSLNVTNGVEPEEAFNTKADRTDQIRDAVRIGRD
jgi:hypothetical protein